MKKHLIVIVVFIASLSLSAQKNDKRFNDIVALLEQKNFFKAKEQYALTQKQLTPANRNYIEACLDNAFNRLKESNTKIEALIRNNAKELSDSLKLQLYSIKYDNSLKLFEYKAAKQSLEIILRDYGKILDAESIDDYKNSLKICTALENQPKQRVSINSSNTIKLIKDKAGLDNLRVTKESDTLNFIFDTGANISTTSKSVAKRLKMKIIPVDIEVGTITGTKVNAQLAVCDKLSIGTIDIYNSVFLVLEDSGLYFPQIDFQIYGIIGYPIIEAFKEIQITQDGNFIVPKQESNFAGSQNLAMDGLTPLILIDGKHYTFDSGANSTMLYSSYYQENKKEIDANYKPGKISFGGAGGKNEFNGFTIQHAFTISGKKIILNDVHLLIEKKGQKETGYGNIGQDVIMQFNKMTLNFNKMFIRFE